jgi:hypothetical protein
MPAASALRLRENGLAILGPGDLRKLRRGQVPTDGNRPTPSSAQGDVGPRATTTGR